MINLVDVTTNGDSRPPFNLKRPQPRCWRCSPPAIRRSIPATSRRRDAHPSDRHRPVQIRRVQAERIDQAHAQPRLLGRRAGRYLDGIEFTIIPNRSTAILAFVAGKFDMTFPTEVTIPLLKDVKAQAPAICVVAPTNVSDQHHRQRDAPPFDNAEIRASAGAGARPQGVHRHPRSRARAISAARCCRRPKACGACRRMMLQDHSGLWPRRRRKSRRSAQADA
jgi:hypothetical protein